MTRAVSTDKRAIARTTTGLAAVMETLAQGWVGAITLGPRHPGIPALDQGGPPDHGRVVAASLAARGTDPLHIDPVIAARGQSYIAQAHHAAVQKARATGRQQGRMIRAGVDKAVRLAHFFIRRRMEMGLLGVQSRASAAFKRRLIRQGVISTAYGNPPPYGICSGRFLRSIGLRVGTGAYARLPAGSTAVARFLPRLPRVR